MMIEWISKIHHFITWKCEYILPNDFGDFKYTKNKEKRYREEGLIRLQLKLFKLFIADKHTKKYIYRGYRGYREVK